MYPSSDIDMSSTDEDTSLLLVFDGTAPPPRLLLLYALSRQRFLRSFFS